MEDARPFDQLEVICQNLDQARIKSEWGSPIFEKIPSANTALTESDVPVDKIVEYYKLITENMADTVWVMDMSLRFSYVSPSAERMYGLTVKEVLGQPIQEAMPPESFELAKQVFLEEMALEVTGSADPKRTRTIELQEYKKDNTIIWVESTLSFIRDDCQKPVGILGVSRDITRRKLVEAEQARLETINRQLQRAESLGRMAGAIAHNLNNQLQIIIGSLDIALSRLSSNAEGYLLLTKAREASRKASEVSRMMLTYLGQNSGRPREIDLAQLCRESLPLFGAAAPKHVLLESDLPVTGPIVYANSRLIQQVLANIITNAWESSGEKTMAIRVGVETVSVNTITSFHRFPVNWQPDVSSYACLTIEDAGCGMIEEDIENLFDPFYTTKCAGRGMGLPVALGILKTYRGCITVESMPEQGSKIRVYLPLSAETMAVPPKKMGKAAKNELGTTVLVIDDEDMVRDIAEMMLERLGYEVITARGGKEGIELFERHREFIDVVISDLTMPGLNGWQTLAGLREVEPQLVVILSSGYDEAHVMEDGLAVDPPSAFLGKPYRLKDLSRCMQDVLSRSKSLP